MCGRYAATLPPEMMAELFKVLNVVDCGPRYNIRPTNPIVAIRTSKSRGGRVAALHRWGLVPTFVKDIKAFGVLINARVEGIAEKPAFRDAMLRGRVVIPADGYYEWATAADGTRRPHYVRNIGNAPLAFAGVSAIWRAADGPAMASAAIVTVEPGLDVAAVHDRMPAVLQGNAIDKWLDTEHVGPAEAAALVAPAPPGTLRHHPVTRRVGKPGAEGPHLVRPLTPDEIAAEDEAAKPSSRKSAAGQLDLF